MSHRRLFVASVALGLGAAGLGGAACGTTHAIVSLDAGDAGSDASAPPSPCTSKADCSGGEVCCLTDIVSMTFSCQVTCPVLPIVNLAAQLCTSSAECVDPGDQCDTISAFGSTYHFCGPPPPEGGEAPDASPDASTLEDASPDAEAAPDAATDAPPDAAVDGSAGDAAPDGSDDAGPTGDASDAG